MKKILSIIFIIAYSIIHAQQSPYMTGALINACNGSCQEGDNEILFFKFPHQHIIELNK